MPGKYELVPCMTCKTPTPIDLLDAKDDGSGDFNILGNYILDSLAIFD